MNDGRVMRLVPRMYLVSRRRLSRRALRCSGSLSPSRLELIQWYNSESNLQRGSGVRCVGADTSVEPGITQAGLSKRCAGSGEVNPVSEES